MKNTINYLLINRLTLYTFDFFKTVSQLFEELS